MENQSEKRREKRQPCNDPLDFTVLVTHESDFRRIPSAGRMVDVSETGVGLVTDFPLQPGHVLEWNDSEQRGKLYIALVKWSLQKDNSCRAGLLMV